MTVSFNETSYPLEVEVSRTTLLVIIPIITIMTVVANGVYIITLAKKRTLHTPSNMLLGALAVSDLLVGIIADPIWMVTISPSSSRFGTNNAEQISDIMMFFFILLSVLNIAMVSADRYIAIFFPFWYHTNATCKTHLKVAMSVLLTSIVFFIPMGIVAMKHISIASYIYMAFTGLSLTITCYCNMKMFQFIRKKGRQVNAVPNETNEEASAHSVASVRRLKDNAIVTVIITVLFAICYLPFMLYFLVRYLGISLTRNQRLLTSYWAVFMMLLNSVINPVVYYIRMSSVRKAFKELFHTRRLQLGDN